MKYWWTRILFLFGSAMLLAACSIPNLTNRAGLKIITSDNAAAQVFLNGKLTTETPYVNNDLAAGVYNLELRPANQNLASYKTQISLKSGRQTVITWQFGALPETSGGAIYEMEKISNSKDAQLAISTIPDGTIIEVDGKAQGFSPVFLDHLSAGEHEYQVSLPSYVVQKNTIQVVPGNKMNVVIQLAKQVYKPNSETTVALPQISSPSASVTPIATSSATSVTTILRPKVVIKATGYFQNGKQAVHVRSNPDPSSSSPGLAYTGEEFSYLKTTTGTWYKISYHGQTAWVSNQYSQLMQ